MSTSSSKRKQSGGLLSRILGFFGLSRLKSNILLVGLDHSGKTTIANFLSKNPHMATVPTIGYGVTKFSCEGFKFSVFDMGGAKKYRNLWSHQAPSADAVIFVIDSADQLRLANVEEEIELLLEDKHIGRRMLPFLIFANKMDKKNSLGAQEIAKQLRLSSLLSDRPWHICCTNALDGEGLEDGLLWLVEAIRVILKSSQSDKALAKQKQKK
eukprot:g1878.t1